MPTENRSSNTEQMVSVPMGALEKCLRDANLVRFTCDKHVLLLQDLVSQPAAQHHAEVATAICRGCFTEQPKGVPCQTCAEVEAKRSAQHQGEPVAYWVIDEFGQKKVVLPGSETVARGKARGYAMRPLYFHPPTSDGFSAGDMADQGAKAFAARDPEVQELRAKLAEAQEVLRDCIEVGELDAETEWKALRTSKGRRLYVDDRALASIAEPIAPVESDQGIPGTSFQRLNMLANQGE